MQWMVIAMLVVAAAYMFFTSDYYNLKCVIARKDGKTYCVRDTRNLKESAELLAEAVGRMSEMVAHMKEKYPKDERVQRLVANFNPDRVVETLPTSEYTAYSEDKGKKLAFCLRRDKNKTKLIDINTLTFVALHELSHLMTKSVGHERDFWLNFKFMLKNAVELGIYTNVDYTNAPQEYCGMTISDNPLLDLKD
jgi:hypothetical protein